MISPRHYQAEAHKAVINDWRTHNAVLVTMATGLGKTFVFLSILNDVLLPGKRGLTLAHRKELIEQPLDRLHSYYPDWRGRAGIVMGETHEPDKQLIIATVQSLASSPRRLDDILSYGPIDYLVTDESHHFTDKNSYAKVLQTLQEANPDLRHLGVTATPIRADGDGLGGVYEKESYHMGIVEGIKTGYLAPVRWLAIQTRVSLASVATSGGDFVKKQLKDVFETDNCFDLVVETHKKYADGRQSIAFTVSVEGAYSLAEKFNAAGISAAAADGTTDKDRRRQVLADFIDGKIAVLCNVGLYTEGLDVPQASCIHQVRPTKSDGLYTQMVGRALRPYPGKDDALVLDYAPIENRNIAMMGDVLGVPLRKEAYIQEDKGEGEAAAGFLFDGNFSYLKGNPADIISRQLDYLDVSPWCWYRKDGWMSLGLGEASDGKERTLIVSPPQDGEMVLYGVAREKENRGPMVAYKIRSGSWDVLGEIAEDYANRYGNATLAAKSRRWRREAATDAQIKYARRIKGAYSPGMKKGELAQSITHHLALREVQSGSVVDLTGRKPFNSD